MLVDHLEREVSAYRTKIRLFRKNARLFLLNTTIIGVSTGVFRLLFNFYALSLGFDEALVGRLLTVSSLSALISALPVGYLSDRSGRKTTLVIGNFFFATAFLGMYLFRDPMAFYALNILIGFGQSLMLITAGPFMMENSSEEERTYLFSFNAGISMLAGFFGNWMGGRIPSWLGQSLADSVTSPRAYGGSIAVMAGIASLGLIPAFALQRQPTAKQVGEDTLSPIAYAKRQPGKLVKLVSPMLITSLGAGLLMPFVNLFFRLAHRQTDAAIGTLFAWGSLAMGIGLLLAPPLADRWGKIRIVVLTQALSIPFLILLGFSSIYRLSAWAYLIRLALMNMSNPIYQAFVMEHVEQPARGTVASLVNMSWNVGWAFSPAISGFIQVRYGFDPIFMGTITTYLIAIYLYWRFFWNQHEIVPNMRER